MAYCFTPVNKNINFVLFFCYFINRIVFKTFGKVRTVLLYIYFNETACGLRKDPPVQYSINVPFTQSNLTFLSLHLVISLKCSFFFVTLCIYKHTYLCHPKNVFLQSRKTFLSFEDIFKQIKELQKSLSDQKMGDCLLQDHTFWAELCTVKLNLKGHTKMKI